MKIAIISDIHGNTPAIEAVLDDIKNNKIDKIYCLGDLLGKGPEPNETIQIIKQNVTQCTMGNWDDFFLYSNISEMPIDWYRKHIGSDSANYLKTLPYLIQLNIEGHLVSLFHAHPQSVYKRISSRSSLEDKLSLFDDPSISSIGGVCIYGDIHYQYIQQLDSSHLIANAGSVGNPLDNNKAKYIILEGNITDYCKKQSASLVEISKNNYNIIGDTGTISLSFKEVTYDTDKAIKLALNSDMPDKAFYIQEVETGVFRNFSNNINKNK